MAETRLAHFDRHWEAELARGYLEDAGIPSRLVSDNLAGGQLYMGNLAGASLLVASERLEAARKAEVRHFIRCMLGVTPTAVIPIVGLALKGKVALLALLCVLVVLVEGWQWIRAGRLVKQLGEELVRLDEDTEAEGEGAGG